MSAITRIVVLFCAVQVSGATYSDDSLVVRAILDSIGETARTVSDVTDSAGGRITVFNYGGGGAKLRLLPPSIGRLTELRALGLSNGVAESLCVEIGDLEKLEGMNLSFNRIRYLPESIGNLTNLEYLSVSFNEIRELPASIGQLRKLAKLYAHGNEISELPGEIANLDSLRHLGISGNRITSFPSELCRLPINVLSLNANALRSLPECIMDMPVRRLEVSYNCLDSLSPELHAWISSIDTPTTPGAKWWYETQGYDSCATIPLATTMGDHRPGRYSHTALTAGSLAGSDAAVYSLDGTRVDIANIGRSTPSAMQARGVYLVRDRRGGWGRVVIR